MPYPHYSADEVAARGEAIYEQQIRAKVEAEHKGKFLVIDIETGEYEIDDDDLAATKRALAKRPEAVLYGLRIGYPTAYRLGVASPYRNDDDRSRDRQSRSDDSSCGRGSGPTTGSNRSRD